MQSLYLSLVALVALVVFAPLAAAGPVPTWDKQINGPGRFKVLEQFNDEAVLDKETGLVWEQSPSTGDQWFRVFADCHNKNVGGRKGWRLPTIEELMSLVDPTVSSPGPTLPPGHPFTNVQSFNYWSTTTVSDSPGLAWTVLFSDGNLVAGNKNGFLLVWCVRGGHGPQFDEPVAP